MRSQARGARDESMRTLVLGRDLDCCGLHYIVIDWMRGMDIYSKTTAYVILLKCIVGWFGGFVYACLGG